MSDLSAVNVATNACKFRDIGLWMKAWWATRNKFAVGHFELLHFGLVFIEVEDTWLYQHWFNKFVCDTDAV